MSSWREIELGRVIRFNPSERITKGTIAKKIAMEKLIEYQRKIVGYELAQYNGGPKFRNGDTLVARITPCLENGKTAQVDILDDDEVAFGSTEFIVLRETEEIVNDFIYYLARSPAFRKKAISCMEGTSGRKRVNENALKLQKLPIPDTKTQINIAKILSAFDYKITLNNRINAELEAMAKTIYDYWFVQFDFPDINGKPYKASGGKMVWSEDLQREIPEEWKVKRLREIAKTGSGGTPLSTAREYYDNGTIPWINSGEVNEPFIVKAEKFITDEGLKNSSAKLFSKGTILMAMYGATAGKVSLMDIEACTNQAICAIVPGEEFYTMYIKYGLEDLYKYLVNLSSGSARDNLSQDKIKDLKFIIPNDEILKLFHETVNVSMKMILINMKENQKLTELRDWLLPMLMNGQIKIKEAEHLSSKALTKGEESFFAKASEDKLAMAAEAEVNYPKSSK